MIFAEHAHEKQQRTNHNRAIGNVERRPVVNANVEIQKVRDLAVSNPVPEIATAPPRIRESARVPE